MDRTCNISFSLLCRLGSAPCKTRQLPHVLFGFLELSSIHRRAKPLHTESSRELVELQPTPEGRAADVSKFLLCSLATFNDD